ncbi:MAG: YraN family protein [Bacteroidaceae bacterium]|nr:YraN family protein [Bacteroidaceae bacterium]
MAKHNILGKDGEDAAVDYLVAHGYTLHERDWRVGHMDLDIIAEKDGEIVFVEVKTRQTDDYGSPEDAVTDKKMRNIINSADFYIKMHEIDRNVRFDIITLIGTKGNFRIEHIIDAFYP